VFAARDEGEGDCVLTSPVARESTIASHRVSVERAIDLMRADLSAPLRLAYLAKAAGMSEFHFTRTFHGLTGLPPLRFLSALRLAKARDMLVSTNASVIEICLAVGYTSIGTFTRRFTELVGISPMRLRQCARTHTLPIAANRLPAGALVRVQLTCPVARDGLMGPALVAAFAAPLPFGRPVACAIAPAGGSLSLAGLALGRYYLLAFANFGRVSFNTNPVSLSIDDLAARRDIDIALRHFELTDPPLLSFVPFILHRGVKPPAGTAQDRPE
jgi:AraC-like DNA-binding protein